MDAAGIYECVVHETSGDVPVVTAEIIIVGEICEICWKEKLFFDIFEFRMLMNFVQLFLNFVQFLNKTIEKKNVKKTLVINSYFFYVVCKFIMSRSARNHIQSPSAV